MQEWAEAEGRGFLFIYTRHINPLNLRTQYKKKNTSTNSSDNAVHIHDAILLLLFCFLIIKEETQGCWADIYLGPPLRTSPKHHQGEQEENEGQSPQQSFIILNARGGGGKEEKKGENTNPIIHTTEWGWYGNGQT